MRPDTRRSWRLWFREVRLPAIVLGVVSLFLVGLFYLQATFVSGTEINASNWSVRRFSFRRDPFTNIQLGGVRHEIAVPSDRAWIEAPTKLMAEIDSSIKKHLSADPSRVERWDLISLSPGSRHGDAKILVDILLAYDADYNNHWTNWSTDNPKLAAILWPAAQDLVYLKIYAFLPDLFELALVKSDDYDLQEAVQSYMVATLTEHCESLVAEHEDDKAALAAEVALTYGESPELTKIVNSPN